jgi:phosphohistidine phosphatase
MDVYLVQHGQALSEEQDPRRPLSEEGRAAATKVASYLAALGERLVYPPLSQIWHSGKLRAEQTAEVYAVHLALELRPTVHAGMKPKDDPAATFEELTALRAGSGAILLAGHLPHLAHLAGLLLTGEAGRAPVRLVNAAVLRLGFRDGSWAVDWYITPACIP